MNVCSGKSCTWYSYTCKYMHACMSCNSILNYTYNCKPCMHACLPANVGAEKIDILTPVQLHFSLRNCHTHSDSNTLCASFRTFIAWGTSVQISICRSLRPGIPLQINLLILSRAEDWGDTICIVHAQSKL